MKTLFNFLNNCLKIKEPWKFYGILSFLAFLIYMIFGGGIGHVSGVADMLMQEQIEVKSEPSK
jgi:hypothetical protein